MLEELEKIMELKQTKQKEKLEKKINELEINIKKIEDEHNASINKSKQEFEEYKGIINLELKKREDAVKVAESTIVSIDKDRETIKKEEEQIKEKWAKVVLAEEEVAKLKIALASQKEEAAKEKKLYETRLAEMS